LKRRTSNPARVLLPLRRGGVLLAALVVAALSACELTEVTLAEPADLVVAEALVQLRTTPRPGGSADFSYVFLHRTLDLSGRPRPEENAVVRILRENGEGVLLGESDDPAECGTELLDGAPGTCYGPAEGLGFEPGERLALEIRLADGGELWGSTVVPGPLELEGRPGGSFCHLPPSRTLKLSWAPSEGTWAYVGETSIEGLAPVFERLGVEVDDPLSLLGLALSAEDTTIVFPAEFGIFDRAELEREVALLLQDGLPAGTRATVSVAAVDRNYVNWARGGNFNPSGQVRVPSVEGDGTGFFGSAYVDGFQAVVTSEPSPGLSPCPGV
jgi:hypothetical protein